MESKFSKSKKPYILEAMNLKKMLFMRHKQIMYSAFHLNMAISSESELNIRLTIFIYVSSF